MILLLSCVTHVLFLFTRKAAYDRWLFNGTWTFLSILTSTWPSFSLFSSYVLPEICVTDGPTFPWKSVLMLLMNIFISRIGTVTCVATSAMLDCQRKNHASEVSRDDTWWLVKIRLLAIKQRALKWYTKLSVHCSQFLFSGLLHPLQPSCFQITLRSQSSHESAAAESSLCL